MEHQFHNEEHCFTVPWEDKQLFKGYFTLSRWNTTAHLDSPWGLQVSMCTGLISRVKLRQLVADTLPAHVENFPLLSVSNGLLRYVNLRQPLTPPVHIENHPFFSRPDKWTALFDSDLLDVLRGDGDVCSWLCSLKEEREDLCDMLNDIIFSIVFSLQSTGIDPKKKRGGRFAVRWLPLQDCTWNFSSDAQTMSDMKELLDDKPRRPTFAYVTSDCRKSSNTNTAEQHECLLPPADRWGDANQRATLCFFLEEPMFAPSSATNLEFTRLYLLGDEETPRIIGKIESHLGHQGQGWRRTRLARAFRIAAKFLNIGRRMRAQPDGIVGGKDHCLGSSTAGDEEEEKK